MQARVARYRIDPERCEDAVTSFREAAAELRAIGGFADGYVLIDRESGDVLTVTLWSEQSALDASEVHAAAVRQRAAQGAGGTVESVCRYDVVYAAGKS